MAGRARAKALADLLEQRTADYFEADPAMTTLDYAADWYESGKTFKELAADLSAHLEHEVTYPRLMAALREAHGAETVEARLKASRARASHSMAEAAIELVDAKADSNVDVSRAASRARTRQWLAERWNPSEYGQAKGVSLNVSIGSLHLDALRAVPARVAAIVTATAQHALPSGSPTDAALVNDDAQVVEVHHVSE